MFPVAGLLNRKRMVSTLFSVSPELFMMNEWSGTRTVVITVCG
jgi:hypothetical protein